MAGRIAPSTPLHAPTTPHRLVVTLSEGHIRLAAHAFNKTPSESCQSHQVSLKH